MGRLRGIAASAAAGPRLETLVAAPTLPDHAAVLALASGADGEYLPLSESPLFEEAVDVLGDARLRCAAARVVYLAVRTEAEGWKASRARVAGAGAVPELVALLGDGDVSESTVADAALALRYTVMGNAPFIAGAVDAGAVPALIRGARQRAGAPPPDGGDPLAPPSPAAALVEALVALSWSGPSRATLMAEAGLPPLLLALLGGDDAPAAARAAAVVTQLAQEPDLRAPLAAAGLVRPLLARFRGDDHDCKVEAAAALAWLSQEAANVAVFRAAWAANPPPGGLAAPEPEVVDEDDDFSDIVPLPVDDDGNPADPAAAPEPKVAVEAEAEAEPEAEPTFEEFMKQRKPCKTKEEAIKRFTQALAKVDEIADLKLLDLGLDPHPDTGNVMIPDTDAGLYCPADAVCDEHHPYWTNPEGYI